MPDLSALIERLEGATGPDKELDADLRWALDRERAERAYWNGAMGMPRPLPPEAKLVGLGRISVMSAFPPLTASIDAALAFVERVLPGVPWAIASANAIERAWAGIGEVGDRSLCYGNTIPLAILIAALKALQEREGEG